MSYFILTNIKFTLILMYMQSNLSSRPQTVTAKTLYSGPRRSVLVNSFVATQPFVYVLSVAAFVLSSIYGIVVMDIS